MNDVRGIEMRGWNWTVEGNDYDVHSNYTPAGIKYNDGEGIMHEAWENVGVRGSRVINNIGNRYICFWRVPVRGLTIKGNQTRIKPNWYSVFVNAQSRYSPDNLIDLPCENVVVEKNITEGGGIKILGKSNDEHVIINNRHSVAGEGKIESNGRCFLEGNINYQIVDSLR